MELSFGVLVALCSSTVYLFCRRRFSDASISKVTLPIQKVCLRKIVSWSWWIWENLKCVNSYILYVELHVTQLFNLRSHFHLHSYWTRNRSNLLPNISRTRIASNFILTIGIQFFNSLDVSIKSAPNSSAFKYRLRNYLLNQYLSETVWSTLNKFTFIYFVKIHFWRLNKFW